MAGHLPIQITKQHLRLIDVIKNSDSITKAKHFERVIIGDSYFQRLPLEYNMNDETGLIDEEIIFYRGDESKYEYFEFHFGKDFKLNQIYLVM